MIVTAEMWIVVFGFFASSFGFLLLLIFPLQDRLPRSKFRIKIMGLTAFACAFGGAMPGLFLRNILLVKPSAIECKLRLVP